MAEARCVARRPAWPHAQAADRVPAAAARKAARQCAPPPYSPPSSRF